MSAVPVASYLAEFGSGADVGSGGPAWAPLGAGDGERGATAADVVSARIEAAQAAGFASGKAAAMAILDARLKDQRAEFERELTSEREAWVAGEAERLATRLTGGLGELEQRLAETTARVLEPFLRAELRRQAIADLRAELEVLLRKDAGIGISVAGPEDLLQALRDRLSGTSCAVTYLANTEPDVRIAAGQTILETRLEAWAAKIAEAVR